MSAPAPILAAVAEPVRTLPALVEPPDSGPALLALILSLGALAVLLLFGFGRQPQSTAERIRDRARGLMAEGYDRDRAWAIAFREARARGERVPRSLSSPREDNG